MAFMLNQNFGRTTSEYYNIETQKTLCIIMYSVVNEYCSTAANVVPSELNVNFARNVRRCVRKTVIERSCYLNGSRIAHEILCVYMPPITL